MRFEKVKKEKVKKTIDKLAIITPRVLMYELGITHITATRYLKELMREKYIYCKKIKIGKYTKMMCVSKKLDMNFEDEI